jgi:hypothetical protein
MTEEYVLDESKLCIKIKPNTGIFEVADTDGLVYIYTPDYRFDSKSYIQKVNRNLFKAKLSLTERCEEAITEAKNEIRKKVKKYNEFAYLKDKYGTCKEKEISQSGERTCIHCGRLTASNGEYCQWCGTKEAIT